jgi:hypothetical protein
MTRSKNPLQILAIFSVSVALTWLLPDLDSVLTEPRLGCMTELFAGSPSVDNPSNPSLAYNG